MNGVKAIKKGLLPMSNYTISEDKKTLFMGANQISFKDDISNVIEFPNMWVVDLSNYSYVNGQPVGIDMAKQPLNNVYCLDNECNILWNIKQIMAPHLGANPDEYYTSRKFTDGILRIFAFHGFAYSIDMKTLKVLNAIFTK